jgi:hypothetical protein
MAADPHLFLHQPLKGREALFQEEHDCIMNDYFQGCQPFPFSKVYRQFFSAT